MDGAKATAASKRELRTAYLELGFVCLFVLLGALVGAEKLIIGPIELMTGMARRFGEGDWSARVARSRLPSEFVPLARAFNAMAAQLSQRERELVATNDRLTVMASIDMLSGLANRRDLQPPDRHRQHRRRLHQAERHPAPRRPDRSRGCRPLRRQTPRPQRRGRARLRADGGRSGHGARGVRLHPEQSACKPDPDFRFTNEMVRQSDKRGVRFARMNQALTRPSARGRV